MDLSLKEINDLIAEYGSRFAVAKHLGIAKSTFYDMYNRVVKREAENTLEEEQYGFRGKVLNQDVKRVVRKERRSEARRDNALEIFGNEIIELLKNNKFNNYKPQIVKNKKGNFGICHLSDLHFNEQVELPNNTYNWEVASKRMKKFAQETIRNLKSYNCDTCVVSLTGDLLNSSRRLDELLLNATNRAKATFLATEILRQFIDELSQHFNIIVASICGNESRIDKDLGFAQPLASENFDYVIYQCLYHSFSNRKDIQFVMNDDPSECLININGFNILLTHGHTISNNVNTDIAKIRAKYANLGYKLDYVIFGHIHEARIADTYARSSSLVGDNDYSSKGLLLTGRASQNCYIFEANGNRHGFKIDLQEIDDIIGYDIHNELEAYNTKSQSLLRQNKTIIEIVI